MGWTLWAYEALIRRHEHPADLLSREVTNWREREQALNLCEVLAAAPGEPLLAWCGNSHATKVATDDWVPMGHHFATMSGVDPFVIDQTVTVDFPSAGADWKADLLAVLADTLAAHGGTAGILSDQAPPPLCGWPGVDALVVSSDNALT
jgi:hypothetical protein